MSAHKSCPIRYLFIYLVTPLAQRVLQGCVGHILCNRKRKAAAQTEAENNDVKISNHHNKLLAADRKAVSSVIAATDERRRFQLTQELVINESWKCFVFQKVTLTLYR